MGGESNSFRTGPARNSVKRLCEKAVVAILLLLAGAEHAEGSEAGVSRLSLAADPSRRTGCRGDLGAERGSGFLRRVRDSGFDGKTLIVMAGSSDREAAQVISQGAAGILLKHSSVSAVAGIIRAVMGGQVDRQYPRVLLSCNGEPVQEYRNPRLSP